MELTTELLSRIQFAFTISFHILFPAFSIGLATFLLIMEAAWLKTQNKQYLNICKFWTKVFALTFGMGVVSGIVMEFQLGTNWAGYTQAVGPVLGSLFTYEVLTAFFIEAGFLGVMIFGWDRVGHTLHFVSTLLVVLGVSLSTFWILSANSWMQYPGGVKYVDGVFEVVSWIKVIFNPMLLARFFHMLLAAYICATMVVIAVSAYYIRKQRHRDFAQKCFKFGLAVLLVLMPLQIYMGDVSGMQIHRYQPIKTAAIEGVWETQKGAPLLLFAWPDQAQEKNHFSVGIPKAASFINTHDWDGELVGLKTVSPEDRPWVAMVFWTFRIMVGAGLVMLAIAVTGFILRLRGKLYHNHTFLRICQYSAPLGFVALITGWFTTEIGRQPWVVTGYLRIADVVSNVPLRDVIISFFLILVVYGIVFGVFYFRYLGKIIGLGPSDLHIEAPPFSYMEAQLEEDDD